MEMGESLKKMLGVSEDTSAPSTFANTPTGVQDTERSSWQSPALLRMTGAVAEKVGDAVQDVALRAGAGVATSAAVATGAELVADPLNFIPGAKTIAGAGVIGQALKWGTSKHTLKQAEALEMLGEPPKAIFERLGIYRGPVDNKWRSVISDDRASLLESGFGRNQYDDQMLTVGVGQKKLSDILEHPTLFKQMPDLADIKVRAQFGGYTGGGYDQATDTIYLGANINRQDLLETVLHEVQHSIQGRHTLTRGGNPSAFLADPKLFSTAKSAIETKIAAITKELRVVYPEFNQFMTKQPDVVTSNKLWEQLNQYKALRESANEVSDLAYQKYRNIGGEAEARAVALQARDSYIQRFVGPPQKKGWSQVEPDSPKGSKFPLDYYDVPTSRLTESPLKDGGLSAFTKGQTIWRGVEKGTEDLAYLFPREVGAHFVANKDTAAKFASHYKGNGEVLERTSNVSKPFHTEEAEQAATWWPHVTATNLLERGKSPLSAEGRVEIKEVRKAWLKDLEALNTKYKGRNADWEAYADAKDALSIKYNRLIVQRLQKEGYDHISYPLNTEEAAKGAKGVEAGIIFNKGDAR